MDYLENTGELLDQLAVELDSKKAIGQITAICGQLLEALKDTLERVAVLEDQLEQVEVARKGEE